MDTHQATRWTQFITPLGGIIALIYFFRPWFTTVNNLRGGSYRLSGFEYCLFNPTVFIAIVMIVSVGLYMVIRRTPWKSRVPVLMSSGIGLAILLAEHLKRTRINRFFDDKTTTELGETYTTELFFWGTVAGLIIAALGTFLIRTEMEKTRPKDSVNVKRLWLIVHAGGILALFGIIFMPWTRYKRGGHIGYNFMEIDFLLGYNFMEIDFFFMEQNPLIIFLFVATVMVLVGSFYTLVSGNLRRLRVAVLVSIGIGLGILFVYYWDFYAAPGIYIPKIRLRESASKMLGRSISFGFYLTILGYIVSAFGMLCSWDVFDQEENKDEQVEVPTESG